jgi:hypothetical protein
VSQQINLFNPVFLKQKKYFSAATMLQALGLILVGSLLLGAYLNLQVSRLKKEGEATTLQLKAVQTRLVEIAAAYGPKRKDPNLEKAIKDAEANLAALLKVSAVLQKGEFGNKTGFAEYFRALSRQVVNGVWLTGFSVQGAGSEIGIHGRTLRPELVPAYLTRLKNEPVMQGKSFATLEMRLPEQRATTERTSEEPRATASYLEFALHSSGAGEKAVTAGERER